MNTPKTFANMNMNMTVTLTDLSIGYKGKRTVASGLTAGIRSGELTCLLGENGVGKSTLLRTLSGFQPSLGGSISIEGQPLEQFSDKELARKIGVVLTEKPDVGQMTVDELVGMGRAPYTGFWGTLDDDDRRVVDEAIRQVGIEPLRTRQVSTLSDGERQKVMIAKALAQETPVIYLDEPTAFLDYPSKVEMLLLLKRISRGAEQEGDGAAAKLSKTIFLSTHDVELALQVADTLWLMLRDGELKIGTPHELARQGVLAQFVERSRDIRFDAESLSIRVVTSHHQPRKDEPVTSE